MRMHVLRHIVISSSLALGLTACLGSGGVMITERFGRGPLFVRMAPPPPVREVVVAPADPTIVWVDGRYSWRPDAGRYVWEPGRYMRVPPGFHRWEPGHWSQESRGWFWVEGGWR